MNRLEIKELRKVYASDKVTALDGVSFQVASGESVAVTGPSGCGKSTLLNLIGTLDTATGGEILLDGNPLMDHRPLTGFRARNLGFVFQFHHLIPGMTVLENVEAPLRALSVRKKTRKLDAKKLLVELGLGGRLNFLPARISGGERQRVAVARALINKPLIIVADEPTGNLDSTTGEVVLTMLLKRAQQQDAMVIFATHDPQIAKRASRIIELKDGRIQT